MANKLWIQSVEKWVKTVKAIEEENETELKFVLEQSCGFCTEHNWSCTACPLKKICSTPDDKHPYYEIRCNFWNKKKRKRIYDLSRGILNEILCNRF